ncbi:MAG: RnfH family protein [Nitrosomonas halophila]
MIEVAYALPHDQFLKRFEVPVGTSLAQAIQLSGVCQPYPEIDCTGLKTGIFGKIVSADTVLQPHDRIEIYRPLAIDPKEKRRLKSRKRTRADC